MATVITREDNVIIYVTNESVITDDDMIKPINSQIKIPKKIAKHIYEVESIPENVKPIKYCYVNDTFSENPNYKEVYSSEDRISALEDVVNMLLGF